MSSKRESHALGFRCLRQPESQGLNACYFFSRVAGFSVVVYSESESLDVSAVKFTENYSYLNFIF
jgi:hypothetical protein